LLIIYEDVFEKGALTEKQKVELSRKVTDLIVKETG